MSELRVRDHSQPCDHLGKPSTVGRVFEVGGIWFHDDQNECPGGREITLHRTERADDNLPEWVMWIEVVDA